MFEDSGNISTAGPIGTPVHADMFPGQIKTLNTAFGKWLWSHFRLLITNCSSHRIPSHLFSNHAELVAEDISVMY